MSFGFFSWLQAVTVAPIECFAVMNYTSHWWRSVYDHNTGNVTGVGFVLTIVLMAIFTAVNFLGIRSWPDVNSAITWWKIAIPVLTIIVLLFKFHGGNFGSPAGGLRADRRQGRALRGRPVAGIVFAYLGFEQADQLAGEIKNAQKNLPRAIITAVADRHARSTSCCRSCSSARCPPILTSATAGRPGLPGDRHLQRADINSGPFAGLAGVVGLSWLAFILRIDAIISPVGTGLIYTTSASRVSYGLARNRYVPQIFAKVDSRGVPWVSLILAFLVGLVFLLPFPSWHALVGLVTGASVLMYAGAPLSLGAFRGQVPDAVRPYRLRAASVLAPARVHRRQPHHLLVGLRGRLEARHRPRHRLRDHRRHAWRSTRSGRRSSGSPGAAGCRST